MNKFISGNEAVAQAVRLARVSVVPAYPITPATTIPEKISELIAFGEMKAKMLCMESEHSAMAATIGAVMSGVRAFTATSSQGLLLMNEMIHWAAGARLPIVMANVNRAICAPWALWADHNDSMSVKDAGWMQFYCQDAQEVLDTILMSFRLSEKLLIPSMICFEGFLVSHTYEPVEIPNQEMADKFLPPFKAAFKLDPKDPHSFGNLILPAAYMETRRNFHKDILRAPKECMEIMNNFENIFGRRCEMILEKRNPLAETIFIAMGTMASTIEEVVEKEPSVGLIRLKMFRPFPKEEILKNIDAASTRRIIVIDRDISCGQGGQLWTEIKAAFQSDFRFGIPPAVYGYVAGLNGQDITPETILGILRDTEQNFEEDKPVIWRQS